VTEYTFRNIVEDIRSGRSKHYATNADVASGEPLMLISGCQSTPFDFVESRPDDDPVLVIVEVDRLEDGPKGIKHFIRWTRIVFGEGTPTFRAEVAFDRGGYPRYDRSVVIFKQSEEKSEQVLVLDLADGETMTTSLKRLSRSSDRQFNGRPED
jgi:desulfoferrodoxin (superoxide reductase-like protein)